MEPIFDCRGEVVGWLHRRFVYSAQGRPRAVVRGSVVGSFAPSFIGWFVGGFFLDIDGAAVGWTRAARGGLTTPPPALPGEPPYPQFAMAPALPALPPVRPLPARRWSTVAWATYLGNDALRPPISAGAPPTMADLAPLIAEAARERQAASAASAARPDPVVVVRPVGAGAATEVRRLPLREAGLATLPALAGAATDSLWRRLPDSPQSTPSLPLPAAL
jgi:hypothetical protein